MRDQQDEKQTRQASEQQSNRQSQERKQRHETGSDSDVDEPQICRGID